MLVLKPWIADRGPPKWGPAARNPFSLTSLPLLQFTFEAVCCRAGCRNRVGLGARLVMYWPTTSNQRPQGHCFRYFWNPGILHTETGTKPGGERPGGVGEISKTQAVF